MEAIGSAAETRDQFLQLLVTQIRHQDPLEPTKQEDFLSQLAQFSTLEGIENLNDNLDSYLGSQRQSQETQNAMLLELQQFQNMTSAANLVGQQISFNVPSVIDADGNRTFATQGRGTVEAVVIRQNDVVLRVNDQLVELEQVLEITTPTDAVETQVSDGTSRRIRTSLAVDETSLTE
jgi:flagellar basal-body rod modification protein FlgD